jgi:hypothetical protein
MENDLKIGNIVEDVLLFGSGRVKQGLLWLESEEAERLGLSLDSLIEYALLNPETSEDFDLSYHATCALGYAREDDCAYADVYCQKGTWWLREHGFLAGDPSASHLDQDRAYQALTDEWRTQLQAVAKERSRNGE